MKFNQKLSMSLWVLVGVAAPSSAVSSHELTFHCSTTCKVYIDGKFTAAISSDGVKVVRVVDGQYTILITRVGKKPWSYAGAITEAMIFDPDQAEPEAFGKNRSVPSPSKVRPPEDPETNSPAAVYPAWLEGLWQDKSTPEKHFTRNMNSTRCKLVSFEMNEFAFKKDGMEALFTQDIMLDEGETGDRCLEIATHDDQQPEDWKIQLSAPVIITSRSDGEISFKLDLSRCLHEDNEDCKIPSQLHDVSGKIVRIDDTRIRLIWQGQLAGAGEQVIEKTN